METDEKQLKLYVWEDVLRDYTPGMVCILAHDLEEAHEYAIKNFETYVANDFFGKPYTVHTELYGVYVYGGG